MPTTFNEAVSKAPITPFQIVTALLCMIILMCEGIDMQLLGLVAPLVIADFGVAKGPFGVAMSAALVGMGVGAWLGGVLGDLVGRRFSLALAALIFGLATIAASTASGIWSMAAWRLLGGLGFGSAFSNALAMTGEWLPERWRAIAITALSVGTPAGGAIAGALAPHLLADHTWRGVFVIFGIATLLLAILLVAVLRDSPSFLMAKGRTEAAETLAGKVLRRPTSLVAEHDHSETATDTGTGVFSASNARLNIGVGVSFAASTLVAYGILNWSTTFLAEKGISLASASYAVSLSGVTAIAGSLAAGWLVRMLGSRIVLTAAGLSLVAVLVALAVALEGVPGATGTPASYPVIALIALSSALFSAAIATIYVIITLAYSPSCRSAGIGFGIFMGRIGAIVASAFGGTMLEFGGTSLVPFFAALVAGGSLVCAAGLVIDRHIPPAGDGWRNRAGGHGSSAAAAPSDQAMKRS